MDEAVGLGWWGWMEGGEGMAVRLGWRGGWRGGEVGLDGGLFGVDDGLAGGLGGGMRGGWRAGWRAWMEEAGWRVLDGEEWMGWRDGGGLVDGGTEPHEPNRTNPTTTRTEPKPKQNPSQKPKRTETNRGFTVLSIIPL